MNRPTVYFNKNFSVTSAQIRAMREVGQFETLASHSDPSNVMLHAADHQLTEPRGLLGDAYAEWLLATCRQHRPAVFIVGKEAAAVAPRRADFERLGVRVVVAASRAVLRELDHKDAFLRGWDSSILPIPAWTTFHDLATFDAAVEQLQAHPDWVPGQTRLCLKPARGIYASGFRVLTEGRDLKSFLQGELYQMSHAEARVMFAQAEQAGERLPTMLLMHTLEGAERSVDCVAWEGTLAAAVVRRKPAGQGGQLIEDRPDLLEAARALAQRYRMSGVFNFQTKDDRQRRPHMLEINARASGGLRYSMAAGINFAQLAAELSLGLLRPDQAPRPTTGLVVAEEKSAWVVREAAPSLLTGAAQP
ncbi:ATP-grasp domain-containing protein [Deinococcus sonorensis]|uniref:ATP-grasp domain-containing protein n=2 Tax=Deinococcus sonorensis TaxID=309891 RepID=A0AAU7UBZ8_9DEIO